MLSSLSICVLYSHLHFLHSFHVRFLRSSAFSPQSAFTSLYKGFFHYQCFSSILVLSIIQVCYLPSSFSSLSWFCFNLPSPSLLNLLYLHHLCFRYRLLLNYVGFHSYLPGLSTDTPFPLICNFFTFCVLTFLCHFSTICVLC